MAQGKRLVTGLLTDGTTIGIERYSAAGARTEPVWTTAGLITAATLGQLDICMLSNSGALSIPNITLTSLVFDTEAHDPTGMHAAGSSANIVPTRTGIYLLVASLVWDGGLQTGYRFMGLYKNGVRIDNVTQPPITGASVGQSCVSVATVTVANSDIFTARALHSDGAALNVQAGAHFSCIGLGTL